MSHRLTWQQDIGYVGNIKVGGRIYQQTSTETYCKVAFVKLYDHKHDITVADMLNNKVLPWYEEQDLPMLRILTDIGSEYCGNREYHVCNPLLIANTCA